ncbi:MAG: hypothetical protein JXJ17_11425 [Anaerolineae bacterium]|nr:hypothetical protein [Anaerolineae bacterium]
MIPTKRYPKAINRSIRWLSRGPAAVLVLVVMLSLVGKIEDAAASPYRQINPDAQRVELLQRSGGLITAGLPLPDGSVLVAEGPALARLDLSGSVPEVLLQSDLGYGSILDLVPVDGRFVALTGQGILTLSPVGDGLPQVIDYIAGGGQVLASHERLIAVAAREAGLRLLRLDENGHVDLQTELALEGRALDVAFSADGLSLTVAAGAAGLHLVDISDPGQPRLVATLPQYAPADAVVSSGMLLAVGLSDRVLVVDPVHAGENPVGIYSPLHEGRRVVVGGSYAYIADARDGLKIMWLTAPDRPIQIYGEADRPAYDLWLEGDLVYLVGQEGLRIIDVSNRFQPLELSVLALPGIPEDITVYAGRAYVALGDNGIAVINVENLSAPRLARRTTLDAPAHAVVYDRGVLFVAADEIGLAIVDPSETSIKMLIGVVPLPGAAYDLAIYNYGLYIAAGEAGLLSLDISYPMSPVLRGNIPSVSGEVMDSVVISGKRAYLSHGDGAVVVDLTSPSQMGRLANLDSPAEHVGVGEKYLYVVSDGQIGIYDVRAAAEPLYRRTYTGLGQVGRIFAQADRLFVSSAGDGPILAVLSLLNPDYPIELDSTDSVGASYRIWPSSDDLWLSGGYAGLYHFGLTEGGALAPLAHYRAVAGADHLAGDDSRLLVGGGEGWTLFEREQSIVGAVLVQSPINLPVRDLAVVGDSVAVAAGESGVALFSLSGSESVLVGQAETRGPATGVTLDDRYVYVSDAAGLTIYDRRYLSPVTHVSLPSPANDVLLSGDALYLPLQDGRLAVIERGEPSGGLIVKDTFIGVRSADLIAVANSPDVIVLSDDKLVRLSIGDSGQFAEVDRDTLPVSAERGLIVDSFAWAYTPGEALRLYDLRYAPPLYKDQYPVAVEDMLIHDDVFYLAQGEGGAAAAVGSPMDGVQFSIAPINALFESDEFTLFTLGESLAAWDISSPDLPHLLAELPLVSPGNTLSAFPGSGLLLGLESGLSVVRWNGSEFSQVGLLNTASAVDHVAMIGQRAYLGLRHGGLQVVDLADPSNPETGFTFSSPTGQLVADLFPLDDRSLLVSWEGGVDLMDVENASTPPYLRDTLETEGNQALDVSISAGGTAAVIPLGVEGVALLDMSSQNEAVSGYVDTPGDAVQAVVDGTVLYVADGVCGLRVFDITEPDQPVETGYWRSGYAGDLLLAPDGSLTLADANQLLSLRYDPDALPVLPPLPQVPSPVNAGEDVPINPRLIWQPSADPCDPLIYDIYFGATDDPPFFGQVTGEPSVQIDNLDPLRTYYWRVVVTDRQGDQVEGPLWRFTTAETDPVNAHPASPPLFIERLRENPLLPLILGGGVLAAVLTGGLYWHRQRRERRAGSPPSSK